MLIAEGEMGIEGAARSQLAAGKAHVAPRLDHRRQLAAEGDRQTLLTPSERLELLGAALESARWLAPGGAA